MCPNLRRIWAALRRAEGTLLEAVRRRMEGSGLSSLEAVEVLLALADAPDERLRPDEIEEIAGLRQYATSRLVDRLERDGLVERTQCPSDGRRQHVQLTARGRAMAPRVRETYERAITDVLVTRIGDDRRGTAQLLERLVDGRPANE